MWIPRAPITCLDTDERASTPRNSWITSANGPRSSHLSDMEGNKCCGTILHSREYGARAVADTGWGRRMAHFFGGIDQSLQRHQGKVRETASAADSAVHNLWIRTALRFAGL
ncbi:hypothetical protein KL944_000697 [Ogataea haglerorum]|nr:hypothetical protein KL944_000697 [Ogataea haglerorum]